jgi:hypothetical protein
MTNSMKTMTRLMIAPALLVAALLIMVSCEGPVHPTYDGKNPDPFPTGSQAPVITEVTPDRGFAGDEIVIRGSGFRPSPTETMVNVGRATATILSITETEIVARLPINPNGDQKVRVAVWGSELWSNEMSVFYLSDFVEVKYNILTPRGVAVDDGGNLFIGSFNDQAIYRIDASDSVMTTFASVPVTGTMEFGPNGWLYVVTSNGLSRVSPDGNTVENVVTLNAVRDFDWAPDGSIYLLQLARIHRFDGTSTAELATVRQAQKLRVFDGYVYVTELANSRVARFEINGPALGAHAVYFQQNTPLAGLDLDASGNVYASAFVRDYVFKAAPDRVNDSDITEFPNETDRNNPFRKIDIRVGLVYVNNSVMYLVQDQAASGAVGRIWRIFIDERNAPRYGRDS